jgi:hypothetical protein
MNYNFFKKFKKLDVIEEDIVYHHEIIKSYKPYTPYIHYTKTHYIHYTPYTKTPCIHYIPYTPYAKTPEKISLFKTFWITLKHIFQFNNSKI